MRSEQLAELVWRHADDGQDVPQRAYAQVLTAVDRDWNGPPVGMLHHVVAAFDPRNAEASALERFDDPRPRYNRDVARHKPASYQKSGHVECQSQLTGWFHHIKQSLKRGAQVGKRLFSRLAITNRADARPELGRGNPSAILILLKDVGHVYVTSHSSDYTRSG